jgi:putative tricarboxylic transport membrane protein
MLSTNNPFDVWVTLGFGVIGWLMQRNGFPVSPLVLAVILGGMMESNLRRSLVMGLGSPAVFLDRPIALIILALAGLSLVAVVRRLRKPEPGLAVAGRSRSYCECPEQG